MMIYANIGTTDEFYPVGMVFENEADFCEAVKNETVYEVRDIVRFIVSGENYQTRKECVRNLALDWQAADQGGISWGELFEVQDFFRRNGKKYGLLREFQENGIC